MPRSPSDARQQGFFGAVGQVGGGRHLRLGGAGEEFFLNRCGDGFARGFHPKAAARQLGGGIGHDGAIRARRQNGSGDVRA